MKQYQRIILIVLLLLVSIVVRLQYDYQSDFDSYWLHAQAESIQIHKSALWVYHPASLFGYYPLSYPSGTMFFLAMFSEMSGLSMHHTVFVSSLFVGLLVIFLTFILTKEMINNWNYAYLTSLVVSFSPIIINYSSFNAGGRIFVMPFYLLALWSIVKLYKTKSWKYVFILCSAITFAFFVHRTAQLTIIFLIAGFGAWFYTKIPYIWKKIKDHQHFKKHVHSRYEKNRYFLLLDLSILFFLAVMVKLADLISRGRLGNNVQNRIFEPAQEILSSSVSDYIFMGLFGLIILIALTYIALRAFFKINILKKSFELFHHHYHAVFEKPEGYFLLALGLFTLLLFIRQFFGASFYSPSISDFQSTDLISGTSPIVIFLNMIINYTTSSTPLFIFSFIGFIYLLVKKERNFSEWMLIFTFIGFSGILLDKRYIRMFIIPFWSIFIILGWFWAMSIIERRIIKNKVLPRILTFIMLLLIFVGAFSAHIRFEYFGGDKSFVNYKPYWETGQYLRRQGDDFSTITTEELAAGVVIFASSGVPGGSHNVYYYVDEDKLQVEAKTLNQVKNMLLNGQKVANIWFLEDWIFGGQYYVGRHALYLFGSPFISEVAETIIGDYNIKYYIHDKEEDLNNFYRSLQPVKNKIYDNPYSNIHDIHRGRE